MELFLFIFFLAFIGTLAIKFFIWSLKSLFVIAIGFIVVAVIIGASEDSDNDMVKKVIYQAQEQTY